MGSGAPRLPHISALRFAGAELVRISLGSRSDAAAVSALVRALRRNVEALRG